VQLETDADRLRLQALLRDLVALSAMPAAWIGREPLAVATGLVEALVEMLQLDFAFVRLSDPVEGRAVEATWGTASADFPAWLESHVETSAFPRNQLVPVMGATPAPGRGVVIPIGVSGAGGVVVAASERASFPTDVEQVLLSLAATGAATAFENARLIDERKRVAAELRDARDQLEAKVAERTTELALSRRRIVATSDEARRRIERDLHDGVQQHLVALQFQVRALIESTELGDDQRPQLDRIASAASEALDSLLEISRGIHPAILSDGGLGPALRALAGRSTVAVELEADIDRRLPEHVEVAAYYVVSEALSNVAKHARASRVQVVVVVEDAIVRMTVRDDGRGGATVGAGSGLVGLQDRVAAVGGTIEIASARGRGTSLVVELPIEAPPPTDAADVA